MAVNHLVNDDGNWRVSYCGKNVGDGVITFSVKTYEESLNLRPGENYVKFCPKCFVHFLNIRKAKQAADGLALTLKMIRHQISAFLAMVRR